MDFPCLSTAGDLELFCALGRLGGELILGSTTTEAQYDTALASFTRNPEPAGSLLRWVCREDEYLNLAEDRLELTPA